MQECQGHQIDEIKRSVSTGSEGKQRPTQALEMALNSDPDVCNLLTALHSSSVVVKLSSCTQRRKKLGALASRGNAIDMSSNTKSVVACENDVIPCYLSAAASVKWAPSSVVPSRCQNERAKDRYISSTRQAPLKVIHRAHCSLPVCSLDVLVQEPRGTGSQGERL